MSCRKPLFSTWTARFWTRWISTRSHGRKTTRLIVWQRSVGGGGKRLMARKLKTYQTSLGFFDLAIAAPSMKAALEA